MIAALYVATGGCYYGLPGVDPWDEQRDARLYAGPWPVVAHPPCARWGRYWFGSPSSPVRKQRGDDGGCFAAALEAARKYGGVIEHPAHSFAWDRFDLPHPPAAGGWIGPDGWDGWSCHVEQGHYGHRARKATWLYAVRCVLPSLVWGPSAATARFEDGYHSAEERVRLKGTRGVVDRLTHKERAATPLEFRGILLRIAESAFTRGRGDAPCSAR